MIRESVIKSLSTSTVYGRACTIVKGNKISNFDIKQMGTGETVSAFVKGSSQNNYKVSFKVIGETSPSKFSCSCPAFSSYYGICKHCAAVMLYYNRYKSDFNEQLDLFSNKEKKEKTTPSIYQLMNRKSAERMLQLFDASGDFGKVRLEPVLSWSYSGIFVEFRIGNRKMYVLKDVPAFARRFSHNESFSYGKQLEFAHSIDAFEPDSRTLVNYILNVVMSQGERRYGAGHYLYGNAEPRYINLSYASAAPDFLRVMKGRELTAYVSNMQESKWIVKEEPVERVMTLTGKKDGLEVRIDFLEGYIMGDSYIYFKNGIIYLEKREALRPIADFLSCMARISDRRIFIQEKDLSLFCRELLPVLKKFYTCRFVDFAEEDYGIKDPEFSVYLDSPQDNMITCRPEAKYDKKKYSLFDVKDAALRNLEKENEFKQMIQCYGNAFDKNTGSIIAIDDDEVILEMLLEGTEKMREFAEVFVSDRIKRFEVRERPQISAGVSISGNMLELKVSSDDMTKEELVEILSRYNPRRKYYRLKNGSFLNTENSGIDSIAELKKTLQLTDRQLLEDSIEIQKYRAMYIDSQLKGAPQLTAVRDKSFRALLRNMKTVEDNDFEVPQQLDRVLRDYQRTGFKWIMTLKNNGFGGILADDMGLGKTLQVISFLKAEQDGRENNGYEVNCCERSTLIVSPASLVYNWAAEFERFAPDIRTVRVVGSTSERKLIIEAASPEDVLITSYDLLKRDVDIYEKYRFRNEIIDEAQYIKNYSTQAARAVKRVNSGFRLALTGTPVENRLSELWSIFDYLMPGFLYSSTRFREQLETPIVQHNDENASERLNRMISPFVLRRLKKDVLKDLPDKLEENVYAKLGKEQQKLYDAHVKRLKLMLDKQSDEEFRTSKIYILSELTKLRQICCDPALLYDDYNKEAAKLEVCIDLVRNAVSGGHKVLLFSQFTSMLSRITERLEQEKIEYYELTGATGKEKRAEMVAAFNTDTTPVFCISLKAGGTGLNLTAADVVIHFDPWWNSAVQNQATDRAYRIGQKNTVNVYRLVAKNTIEENIVEMQEKKKELSDKVLGGEAMEKTSFTKDELMEILKERM